MSPTSILSDRKAPSFSEKTLAMDRELRREFEVDLLLMPEELRQNSIVAAQWHTAGDKRVCPLCASQEGNVYPVDSPEWGRMAPPIHMNCRCILSYITSRERGVQERIEKYEPIDPDLLKKWSSKVYTDAEIREMAKKMPAELKNLDANITREEKEFLKSWTDSPTDVRRYLGSNSAQREILRKELGDELYQKVKNEAKTLQAMFKKYYSETSDVYLYRGLSMLDEKVYNQLKNLPIGQIVPIDKAPSSWSLSKSFVLQRSGVGKRAIIFKLDKGRSLTKELSIGRHSIITKEQEVIVQNTKFRVTAIKEHTRKAFDLEMKDVNQKVVVIYLGEA